ncbi:hypothetical protein ACJIZ3_019417 [Penstemon smallii]|uniref:non-specific serine/threonine protein kinase n=1 Tax=Penstemon smallii TaxID=265156 RepID=A0ABD3T151_9LAMI
MVSFAMGIEGSVFLVLLLLNIFTSVSGQSFEEKRALLQFKESIFDPCGILKSWINADSSNHCSWFGVSCNSKFRVSKLKIEGNLSLSPYCSFDSEYTLHAFGIRRNCSVMNGKLAGKISPVIGNLTQLKVLSLPFNEFDGEIPVEIWRLKNLEVLDLEGNFIVGNFSGYGFTSLRKLRILNLAFNRISGKFPSSLSKCRDLSILNLEGNKINDVIPGYVVGLRELRVVNLSFNKLIGSIPSDLDFYDCDNLEHLDLSVNFLEGVIPRALGNCNHLRTLVLSSNGLHGHIPHELGRISTLKVLDISRNSLRGPLPANLGNCINLSVLVLSSHFNDRYPRGEASSPGLPGPAALDDYNSFEGPIPYEITTLPKLEIIWAPGAIFESRFLKSETNAPSKSGQESKTSNGLSLLELASIISASLVTLLLLAFIAYFYYTGKKKQSSRIEMVTSPQTQTNEVTIFNNIGVQLTYESIIQATRNFNRGNCIGNGGFGSTYKAEISPGNTVAVKRLTTERHQGAPQFHAEVSILGRIKHPNLITLIGYFASQSEMFLIYNYLPGGNLNRFIRERGKRAFNWREVKDFFTASLWGTGPRDKLVKMLHLAICCTTESLSERPMMSQVVCRLKELEISTGYIGQ